LGSSQSVPGKLLQERLIASHLPLVRSIARRHTGQGEELEDLVQVGAIGLMKASDRFDPDRGVSFGTFAAPVIEGEIRRHLRDRARPVRIPREMERIRGALRRSRGELTSSLGRAPTVPELAAALRVNEDEVERALSAERAEDAVSLSAGSDTAEVPADGESQIASDDRLLLASSMRSLDERERRIVLLRFHGDMTERQIAREIGVSQAHVSRLLSGALAKLRKELGTTGVSAPESDITVETVTPAAASSAQTAESSPAESETPKTVAQYLELPYGIDVSSDRDGDRSAWTARVEELPGCAARGKTRDEALAGLRVAMKTWLSSAIAENREIPVPAQETAKPKTTQSYSGRFLVRMPKSLHEQLARAAEKEHVSLNRYVTDALAAAVTREDSERSTTELSATSRTPSPRSLRVALATNLVVVVLAGAVAIVLLVLALQRGI
jgi:RNA polymerase sigma-B factor